MTTKTILKQNFFWKLVWLTSKWEDQETKINSQTQNVVKITAKKTRRHIEKQIIHRKKWTE